MPPRLCKYLIYTFLAVFSYGVSAQQCGDKEYINWMGELVESKKEKLGGLAQFIPTSLAIAQAALETGYGESYSAQKRKNHFGLRSGGKYLVFSNAKESVEKYLETLSEKRYYRRMQGLIKKGETNPIKLLRVMAPVYAEDDGYIKKISAVIDSCDLRSFDSWGKISNQKSPLLWGFFLLWIIFFLILNEYLQSKK